MFDSSANPRKTRKIGDICDLNGQLEVVQKDGRFFWDIVGNGSHFWEEIPEYLFVALNRFQDENEQAAQKSANTCPSSYTIPPHLSPWIPLQHSPISIHRFPSATAGAARFLDPSLGEPWDEQADPGHSPKATGCRRLEEPSRRQALP